MQMIRARLGAIGTRAKQLRHVSRLINLRVIVLLVLALSLVALSFEHSLFALNSGLEDKVWVLESFGDADNQQPIFEERRITVKFVSDQGDQFTSGNAGCSDYRGDFEVSGNSLTIEGFSTSPVYCWGPEGSEDIIMVQQSEYLAALDAVESFQITDDKLELFYESGTKLLTYFVEASAVLDDTTWMLSSYGDINDQIAVLDFTTISLRILREGATRVMQGHSGCNSYWVPFEANGTQLTVNADELSKTAKFCVVTDPQYPETIIIEQEVAYRDSLLRAESFQISGNKLEIFYDSAQKVLTFFIDPATELPSKLWWLVSFGEIDSQQPLLAETWAWIRFLPEGLPAFPSEPAIDGHGGCNLFDAHYETDGNELSVFGGSSLTVSCDDRVEGLDDQDTQFQHALQGAESFLVTGNKLEIFYNSGQSVLTFRVEPVGILQNRSWRLFSYGALYNQTPVLETTRLNANFLQLDTRWQVNGHAGCNSYLVLFESLGREIEITHSMITASPCVDPQDFTPLNPIREQEQAFFNGFANAESLLVTGDKLEIFYDSGLQVLTFFAELLPELDGETWLLDSLGDSLSRHLTIPETKITLTFNYSCPSADEVRGASGCNGYWGVAKLVGKAMSVSSLYNTLMACIGGGVQEQEDLYKSALRQSVRFEIEGSELRIFYGSGDLWMSFSAES